MMGHDFCREAYFAMLRDLPPEEVARFWQAHPVDAGPDGKLLEGADLLRFLWQAEAEVPVPWVCAVADALEPFLASLGRTGPGFLRGMLRRCRRGTWIRGQRLLPWFYPVMDGAFNARDARDLAFSLCTIVAENVWPGHRHRRVKREEADGWATTWMAYLPDPSFANRVAINFDWLIGEQILASPRVLGLEAFEEIRYLADIRPAEAVLADGAARGRRMAFSAFLAAQGLDLSAFSPPDGEVTVIDADVECPVRKRVVLHAGCAYGAPLYLSAIRNRMRREGGENLLESLIEDAAPDSDPLEAGLAPKHEALLRRLEARAAFLLHAADGSISLNGKHFLKNIPARILARILSAYTREGKSEFEYRDFKRDFDITYGQKNSNFEIRFYRLLEKLDQEKAGIRIEKQGRGAFRIRADVKVEFGEAP